MSADRAGENGAFADQIIDLVSEDADTAAVALFIELCRASPTLRNWLLLEFGGSEKARAEFRRRLDGLAPPDGRLLAEIAGQSRAYFLETSRLRERFGHRLNGFGHGGLNRREIERLIRHYQAGRIDAGTFLLANAWRRQGADGAATPPQLIRASCRFLAQAAQPGGAVLLSSLVRAFGFFDRLPAGATSRTALGHERWWKLSLLLYILNHPKRHYRVREFREHLAAQRLQVDATDIRKFCKRHGIARDTRAGRPRTRPPKTRKIAKVPLAP